MYLERKYQLGTLVLRLLLETGHVSYWGRDRHLRGHPSGHPALQSSALPMELILLQL